MSGASGNPSFVRKPRPRVTANGTELRIVKFEVVQNATHSADEFSVDLPLFDPLAPYDWTWWASQTDIEIAISVGFADVNENVGSWTQLIVGPVDAVALSPLPIGGHEEHGGGYGAHRQGAVLTVRGRDYSGVLMDSPMSMSVTGAKVQNSTIAKQIQQHVPQLTIDLSALPDSVGSTYHATQGRFFLNRSAWDILTALADHEGMRVVVQGKTVNIQPVPQQDAAAPYPIVYTPGSVTGGTVTPVTATVETIRMTRSLQLGKGIDHFVESYDSATGRLPSRSKASSRGKNSSSAALTYTENQPGMTKAQARKHAGARADQISRFERDLEFQLPGDPTLTVERAVVLSGTGTAFDQAYIVDQITHRLDVEVGYAMEVRVRNRSADGSVTTEDVNGGHFEPAIASPLAQPPSFQRDKNGKITGFTPSMANQDFSGGL